MSLAFIKYENMFDCDKTTFTCAPKAGGAFTTKSICMANSIMPLREWLPVVRSTLAVLLSLYLFAERPRRLAELRAPGVGTTFGLLLFFVGCEALWSASALGWAVVRLGCELLGASAALCCVLLGGGRRRSVPLWALGLSAFLGGWAGAQGAAIGAAFVTAHLSATLWLSLLNHAQCLFVLYANLNHNPEGGLAAIASALALVRALVWWGSDGSCSTAVVDCAVGACVAGAMVRRPIRWPGLGLVAGVGGVAGLYAGKLVGPIGAFSLPRRALSFAFSFAFNWSVLPVAVAHTLGTREVYGYLLLGWLVALSSHACCLLLGWLQRGGGGGGSSFVGFAWSAATGAPSALLGGLLDGHLAWLGGALALGLLSARYYDDSPEHRRATLGHAAFDARMGHACCALLSLAAAWAVPGLLRAAEYTPTGVAVASLLPPCSVVIASFAANPEAVSSLSDCRVMRLWGWVDAGSRTHSTQYKRQLFVLAAPLLCVGSLCLGLGQQLGFAPCMLPLLAACALLLTKLRANELPANLVAVCYTVAPLYTALALDGYIAGWDGYVWAAVHLVFMPAAVLALFFIFAVGNLAWHSGASRNHDRMHTARLPQIFSVFWLVCAPQLWRASSVWTASYGAVARGGADASFATAAAISLARRDLIAGLACAGLILLMQRLRVPAQAFNMHPPRNVVAGMRSMVTGVRERAAQARREEEAVRAQQRAGSGGAAQAAAAEPVQQSSAYTDLWDDPTKHFERVRAQREFDARVRDCETAVRQKRSPGVLAALEALRELAAKYDTLHTQQNLDRLCGMGRHAAAAPLGAQDVQLWGRFTAKAFGRVLREMTAVARLTKELHEARALGDSGATAAPESRSTMSRSVLSRSTSHEHNA